MSTVRDLAFFFLSTLTVILVSFSFFPSLSIHMSFSLASSFPSSLPSIHHFLPSFLPTSFLPFISSFNLSSPSYSTSFVPSISTSCRSIVRPFFILDLFLSSPLSGCDRAPFLRLQFNSCLPLTILSSRLHFPSSPFPPSHHATATFSWRGLLCSADCTVIICSYSLI